MVTIFFILLCCSIFTLIMTGIAFRNAPQDPYQREEEERFIENSKKSDIQIITDDGEEDEEIDEETDNENEEDQD